VASVGGQHAAAAAAGTNNEWPPDSVDAAVSLTYITVLFIELLQLVVTERQ